MKSVIAELQSRFEQDSGKRLSVKALSNGPLVDAIKAGQSFDVVLHNDGGMREVEQAGKIDAATRTTFARFGIGLAVKAGAPKPDISSPDAFKRVLLDAKSIAYISGGRSGPHFISVTERLGIADEVKAKAKTRPSGEAAALVASGEAEVAIQQVPELAAVTGVDVVGPIPSALQSMTELMAAASSSTKDPATARAFLQFLRSADAKTILKARSFEPE